MRLEGRGHAGRRAASRARTDGQSNRNLSDTAQACTRARVRPCCRENNHNDDNKTPAPRPPTGSLPVVIPTRFTCGRERMLSALCTYIRQHVGRPRTLGRPRRVLAPSSIDARRDGNGRCASGGICCCNRRARVVVLSLGGLPLMPTDALALDSGEPSRPRAGSILATAAGPTITGMRDTKSI